MISFPPKPTRSFAKEIGAPLRSRAFRRIWVASLLSNFGSLIQGVGAAWAMTQMTASADKVALVQTALMLPVMLVALPAGAIADMYDRRKVALASLTVALAGAIVLTVLSWLGLVTPNRLLALCFVVGTGVALMGPAWQSSVSEQVPSAALPAAIALNGISYNIARSVGPAIGGIVVAAAGAVATFALNVVFYLPLIAALLLWKREVAPSRLPPEQFGRAMISGVRYIANSPPIKVVLIRALVVGVLSGAIVALMPLVTRDLLSGGPAVYGSLLSAFGVGAIVGALNVSQVRSRLSGEAAINACALIMGCSIAAVAVSRELFLTLAALFAAGFAWTLGWSLLNIAVQLSAPRWVAGRSLAAYQAAASGGIALGSWGWGRVTNAAGVETALLISAGILLLSPLLGRWLTMPGINPGETDTKLLDDPEVRLELTGRSGPLIVEIEYRVRQEDARAYHTHMHDVQLFRQRNGAYGWSISRDIADPELWTERYHCPTWHDYLRQRNRSTPFDREVEHRAISFHVGPQPIRVKRMLERPFGSLRRKEETHETAAPPSHLR